MYTQVSTAEKLPSPDQSLRSFGIIATDRTYTCICDSEEECRSVTKQCESNLIIMFGSFGGLLDSLLHGCCLSAAILC